MDSGAVYRTAALSRLQFSTHHSAAPTNLMMRILLLLALAAQQQQPTSIRPLVPTAPKKEQQVFGPSTAVPASARGVRDRGELAAFLDGVMEANLRDKHVAGATVAVVKDGALFFAKGYGYSDVARRAPGRSPSARSFASGRRASCSRGRPLCSSSSRGSSISTPTSTSTSTSRFRRRIPQPITLRHIMTHTPGFEEDGRDLITDDSTKMIPLGRWLATHIPGRVRPPGTYCVVLQLRHGARRLHRAARLGRAVRRLHRAAHPHAVRHDADDDAPAAAARRLKGDMSEGYAWAGGTYTPQKYEIVNATPGRLDRLERDRHGEVHDRAPEQRQWPAHSRRVDREAHALARVRPRSAHPRVRARLLREVEPRVAHHRSRRRHALVPHGPGAHSGREARRVRLVQHEHAAESSASGPSSPSSSITTTRRRRLSFNSPPTPRKKRARVAGEYEFNRRSYTTFQKAIGLAGDIRISAGDSGRLIMHSGLGDSRLVPVGPLLYRDELGGDLVAFQADGKGKVERGFIGEAPMMTMERVPFRQSAQLHWFILGLGMVVFVGILLAAIGRFVRRRFGEARADDALPGRWLLVTLSLLELVFLVAVVSIIGGSGGLLNGPLTSLKVALALPVIATICTLAAVYVAARQWRGKRRHARGAVAL